MLVSSDRGGFRRGDGSDGLAAQRTFFSGLLERPLALPFFLALPFLSFFPFPFFFGLLLRAMANGGGLHPYTIQAAKMLRALPIDSMLRCWPHVIMIVGYR